MNFSRRSFLKLGLALPSLKWFPLTTRKDSPFDPWVEINSQNLRHNIAEISKRVEGRPILAVIKNNGYGLGLVNVARILEPLEPVTGLAVVKLQEAVTLREAGIQKPVLLMGPFDENDLREMVEQNITPMVDTPIGPMLEKVSQKYQKTIPIHICVDTGLGREGVPYLHAPELIRDLASRKSIRIEGIMMTFTEDPEFDKVQLRRFLSLCDQLKREGIGVGQMHTVSTFGMFQHPDAFLDMVRPGMAIFGIYPEQEFRQSKVMELRPAVSLKAKVIYVRQLRKGDSAGYNRAYVASDDVWLATVPAGHADGLPRIVAKGARVRIRGDLYPIIAISASHSIVEIGAEQRVQIGDVVTFFDWQEGSRPEDIAAACGASVYDLTMHLNPLLPRRIL